MSVLKGNPMTDEEIFTALAQHGYVMSPSGARTRRKELVDLGLVEDTGVTILTKSGRGAIVWRMV